MQWNSIKEKVVEMEQTLPIDYNLIPLPFNRIAKDGLSYNYINRMSFEEVKTNLEQYRSVSIALIKITNKLFE